jgi:16S rRNA (adenine1518-N6/adenine1519-N6)-dimethyltransferase
VLCGIPLYMARGSIALTILRTILSSIEGLPRDRRRDYTLKSMLAKSEIKRLEKKYGFSPQRKLGQNFLIDSNIRNKLLNHIDVTKEDIVLEIGSGLGQLTFELAKITKKVIAIEFDKKLFSILSRFAEGFSNVVLVHEDFLKFNLRKFIPKNKKIKVISNLPYYISTPVILKLFAHSEYIISAILTLQKEVADKFVAEPRSKEYGSLTLFAEFHSEIKKLFNISKNCFYPAPKVASTVIFLKIRENAPVEVADKNDLFELIRAGFSVRRKTLVNAMLNQRYQGLSKAQAEKVLRAAGIPLDARAETLSLPDFARISNSISNS